MPKKAPAHKEGLRFRFLSKVWTRGKKLGDLRRGGFWVLGGRGRGNKHTGVRDFRRVGFSFTGGAYRRSGGGEEEGGNQEEAKAASPPNSRQAKRKGKKNVLPKSRKGRIKKLRLHQTFGGKTTGQIKNCKLR